jgi:hypothetical protein
VAAAAVLTAVGGSAALVREAVLYHRVYEARMESARAQLDEERARKPPAAAEKGALP